MPLSGDAKKEYNKKYYSKNKDKLKKPNSEAHYQWREENKDKVATYNKKYYQKRKGIDTELKRIKTLQTQYSIDGETANELFALLKKHGNRVYDTIKENGVDFKKSTDIEFLGYLLEIS